MRVLFLHGRCKDTRSRCAAFTLLEVMISLAVAGSLITLIYTLNYHLDIAGRHESATVSLMLGKEKLVELRDNPAQAEGEFPAPYSGYRYKTAVEESPYPDIKELSVTVIKDKDRVVLKELVRSDIK